MLAPLKDRSILERDCAASNPGEAELLTENAVLRQHLRESRHRQKSAATTSTRQIVELTNKNYRLAELNRHLQARINALESGQAIIALGRQLMALRQENEELAGAAQRVWFLDRSLYTAHRECERLTRERDTALDHLQKRADKLIT